jgi:hypothetical protein
MRVIFDIETFPNCFTLTACTPDGAIWWYYEVSDWRNDRQALFDWLQWLGNESEMVGFNNISFDYPVIHAFVESGGEATSYQLYEKAQELIFSQDSDRFANIVYPSDRYIKQIDLYKIHHFDNKARSTSLKALEFNMRLDSVEDLPFPVGTLLTKDQVEVLRAYNKHDVEATRQFYLKSLDSIRFREKLTAKHGRDFSNHNDTKIGAEIFQIALEAAGVQTYEYGASGRIPRQTKRESINLHECVPQWVEFAHPEFQRIKNWFNAQVITETKGVFKDITAHVDGLDYIYGTGGLHASVTNSIFVADDEWMIYDMDVTSLYPSIAIEHGHYPEHLGPQFVDVYRDLRTQRIGYKKGTAENAMLKLALNGVYGKSNDKFSIFYDPLFTMRITLGGQMMLSKLAELLITVPSLDIIQVNTDGITIHVHRSMKQYIDEICASWQQQTKLSLEYAEYDYMAIRDVNNYIARKPNGDVKRKGAYEYDLDWHQNGSALIVPKVAEQVLLEGVSIRDTVMNWPDLMDFCKRVKVPRSSRLEGDGQPLPNMLRYYVSEEGVTLTKIMPPLAKKPDVWRRIGVESGWTVCPCNHVRDAVLPINYEYYIAEVEKLVLPLKEVK